MLHIAICDDNSKQLALVRDLVSEYKHLHPELDIRTSEFISAAALLEYLRTNGCFDIYFLDVLMPNINGIELGLKIRQTDKIGHIIYLSASPDYAIDSYLTKASHYLLQPINKELLFPALDETIAQWLSANQSFVTLKTRNGLQRIPLRSVVYGELVGHCVQYHLSDGSSVEGMSLRTSFKDAVSSFLEHERFVLCATSFFVNLAFVDMVEAGGLRLSNGKLVPLSRTMRSDVTNRWLDYHLKGGNNA